MRATCALEFRESAKSVDSEAAKSADSRGLPRGFDVIMSLVLLLLSAPVLLASAVTVALTSRGGVLFCQKRVGRNGEPFILYKLRTMRPSSSGPQVTHVADARITPVGKFLRQTKLDELPTLWNVLKGEMALVGPRPEVPRYVKLEDPLWQAVLSARPGITDPITLRLRNEQELLAKVSGDMEKYYLDELLPLKLKGYVSYLRDRSWRTDLKVLWQTVAAVVWRSR